LVPIEDAVHFTELGTLDDLASAMATARPVVLHFCGHGAPGNLVFEDEEGAATRVAVPHLLERLRQGAALPHAIWLSCCHGASEGKQSNTSEVAAEALSVAAGLHRGGIAQVLG